MVGPKLEANASSFESRNAGTADSIFGVAKTFSAAEEN